MDSLVQDARFVGAASSLQALTETV
jgi:hypothetical protein